MTKKLLTIISENWDTFSKSLNLELKNEKENYLLMINELKPSIKLVNEIIENHNYNKRINYIKIGNPEYHSLIKMGLMNYDSETKGFNISTKGEEINKSFYNFNHLEEKEKKELSKKNIDETKY